MTKSDIVREYIKENPEVKREDIPAIMMEMYPETFGTNKKAWAVVQNVFKHPKDEPPRAPTLALSEQELREMYDIKAIVMRELKELKEGEFWRDADFTRKFQGKAGYRPVLESADASLYRGKASGQVFWGHPRSISKMKNDGVLI